MAAASASRARPRPAVRRRSALDAPAVLTLGAGVRWDRVGRVAMLCVLAALVYLYVSAGVHMLSTWRQAGHDKAAVAAMEREHAQLWHQHQVLSRPEALEVQARQLGMIKAGEQPYLVTGLPNN
jgi:cell division protein FtsB